MLLQIGALALGEEGLDGFLTRMAEGRIAQVMGQTGSGHNLSYLGNEGIGQSRITTTEMTGHIIA